MELASKARRPSKPWEESEANQTAAENRVTAEYLLAHINLTILEPPLRLDLPDLITESAAPPRWLIENLLYQDSLVCLAGVPGVGKSTFAYSLAIAVASGLPFLGLPATTCRVLYIDEENNIANIPTYFRWAWIGNGSPDIAKLSSSLRVEMNTIASHQGPWAEAILLLCHEFRPGLIILDTTTPCCRIKDENDNSEASHVVTNLRRLQAAAASNTTILALKHARVEKDPRGERPDTYKMRGASTWAGATDGTIFHLAHPGRPHANGLRSTYLLPEKTRAYGLRSKLVIDATWTDQSPEKRGLKLSGNLT